MMRRSARPVAVLGGGLGGLTAANFLQRQGVPVLLFEAGSRLAGLAQSFHDADGFTYDFGAHFITNRLAAAVGVSRQCRTIPRYGESVWLDGRVYSYPFGLLRAPRFTLSALAGRLRLGAPRPANAAEWFRARYGRRLADEVAIPLTEAWSGVPAAELAASVGDSIPGSIAQTLYLKLWGRLRRRAIAIGYSREIEASPHVWHVYPEGGVGLLCQELARPLGQAVHLESPVEAIHVDHERVAAVAVNGRCHDVAAVVSTAPCNVLARLVRGTRTLEYLNRFQFRPMIFVNLRLEGRNLLPDVVMWTPESRFPFFRLTETPLSMPWLAPEGKTLLTVDIGCRKEDEAWTMADEALAQFCLEPLTALIPDVRSRYQGCRVLRTPIAYPVFKKEYETDRLRFLQSPGVAGLCSVGRNGEFLHIFMEDVYWRTLNRTRQLLRDLG